MERQCLFASELLVGTTVRCVAESGLRLWEVDFRVESASEKSIGAILRKVAPQEIVYLGIPMIRIAFMGTSSHISVEPKRLVENAIFKAISIAISGDII